jgi:hypothetical protein
VNIFAERIFQHFNMNSTAPRAQGDDDLSEQFLPGSQRPEVVPKSKQEHRRGAAKNYPRHGTLELIEGVKQLGGDGERHKGGCNRQAAQARHFALVAMMKLRGFNALKGAGVALKERNHETSSCPSHHRKENQAQDHRRNWVFPQSKASSDSWKRNHDNLRVAVKSFGITRILSAYRMPLGEDSVARSVN